LIKRKEKSRGMSGLSGWRNAKVNSIGLPAINEGFPAAAEKDRGERDLQEEGGEGEKREKLGR